MHKRLKLLDAEPEEVSWGVLAARTFPYLCQNPLWIGSFGPASWVRQSIMVFPFDLP